MSSPRRTPRSQRSTNAPAARSALGTQSFTAGDEPSSPMKYPPTSPATGSGLNMENTDPNIPPSSAAAGRRTAPRSRLGTSAAATGASMADFVTSPLAYPSSQPSRPGTALMSQSQRTDFLFTGRSQPLLSSTTGTPTRIRRNDIQANANIERFLSSQNSRTLPDSDVGRQATQQIVQESADADPSAVRALVWATTVDPNESMTKFKDFLLNFTVAHRLAMDEGDLFDPELVSDDDKRPYYPRVLGQRLGDAQYILNLDCMNLKAYPPAACLYDQLVRYPQEIVMHVMDFVTTSVFAELYGDNPALNIESISFKVRPYNLDSSVNLRDLNPEDIDKVVSIKGFVVRVSNPIPEMKRGYFKCTECDGVALVDVENGVIEEPSMCRRPECGLGSMQIIHGNCTFYNKQAIRLQETPDAVPDGQTPHTVTLLVYDEMLDCVKPGDRVEVTGIYKAMPLRVNPKQRATRSIFKTYVDVLHVMSAEKKIVRGQTFGDLGNEHVQIEGQVNDRLDKFSPELTEKIQQIAASPNVYERLAASLAPSIFENEDVKKAVLLQLFGGSNKTFAKSESTKYRGNIHVLLCGDPAMSKSQILQYVHKLAPRSMYTSGKGSSAVGLTAYVTKDPETKQLVLESGALVLSDGGICCIDEFDKMSDSTRSVLHEVMEQQTISVAKAGIITTLNARTSILAAANPIHSKWNPKLPVVQNVNLPPTLLSRFDVIFLMLDQTDERRDTMLARHLVGLYLTDVEAKKRIQTSLVDIKTFAAYVAYAREYCHPRMDDECMELIASRYVRMRQRGSNKTISATTRQLEAIIRLSEAHAKVRLSETVGKRDVDEAIRLIDEAMKMAAMDPTTGMLDMDLLTSGHSAHERQEARALKVSISHLLSKLATETGSSRTESISKRDLFRLFNQQSQFRVNEMEFEASLKEALEDMNQQAWDHGLLLKFS